MVKKDFLKPDGGPNIQSIETATSTLPMVLARLLQAADPGAGDVALDIGCGSGYATAILARLTATVVALESDGEMAGTANRLLSELGIDYIGGILKHSPQGRGLHHRSLLSGLVGSDLQLTTASRGRRTPDAPPGKRAQP